VHAAIIILVHVVPSPVNPLLHVHWKLPMVSVHTALVWQLSIPSLHSLTSGKSTKEYDNGW